ncbi:MAG: response regulator [Candidatus Ancaeobacter aquaticus]|nr:response regulator [Candidatus Ancaeobacter aquaticus]
MSKKILIVDDDLNIAKLLASRLKANNYDICVACDGLSAVSIAHREKPDLIILDMMLPAGSGFTVFENLRKSVDTFAIPIIFITAFPDKEKEEKAFEMGAEGFIAKPFEADDLLLKVKKALGE